MKSLFHKTNKDNEISIRKINKKHFFFYTITYTHTPINTPYFRTDAHL